MFGPVVKMSFKYISIFSSGGHFSQQSIIVFCNFGRGHYEEHLYEIILNLDRWFRSCRLDISYLEALLFGRAEPFEEMRRNFCEIILNLNQLFSSVKLFLRVVCICNIYCDYE